MKSQGPFLALPWNRVGEGAGVISSRGSPADLMDRIRNVGQDARLKHSSILARTEKLLFILSRGNNF